MDFAILILAIPICIADTSSFTIPNIYSKFLFYAASIHLAFFGLGNWVDVSVGGAILLVMMTLGVGMGDIKILALILITHTHGAISIFPYVFLFAAIHIMIFFTLRGHIPSRIALAPSIFLGFATYLATP
jgi:Flp pilus assembly protein protease CpaA